MSRSGTTFVRDDLRTKEQARKGAAARLRDKQAIFGTLKATQQALLDALEEKPR